jgi:glucans biosynthesis protein C
MSFNATLLEDRPTLEVVVPPKKLTKVKSERIHAIDWLRVLAFGILMVYHTAEVFTTWNWWIKNEETSPVLSYTMQFFHEWRMFLLFVISGAATHLALGKRSVVKFLSDRVTRIVIPLLAGMLLVIPPQIYYIRLNQGENLMFIQFYSDLIQSGWFPKGNVHWLHLWYMAFLFVFIVSMVPVISAVKSEAGQKITGQLSALISKSAVLFPLAVLLEVPYYLSIYTGIHENIRTALLYFPYYAFGALFLVNEDVRRNLVRNRRTSLLLGTCTTAIFYLFFWIKDPSGMTMLNLDLAKDGLVTVQNALETFNRWFWVLAITGYGLNYLTTGAPFLNYANQAVAPFYILHQTVIIIAAYHTVNLSWDLPVKFYMILTTTFCSIFLLYHFVLQRFRLTQLMFGIKGNSPRTRPVSKPFLYSRSHEPQTETT